MRAFCRTLAIVGMTLVVVSAAWADSSAADQRGHSGHDGSGGSKKGPSRVERHIYTGHRPRPVVHWGGAYRVPYSPGYGYPAYPDYYPAYPGYYPVYPGWYSPYPPPVYLPAEELYGPRAVQRFMGVENWFQQSPSPSTTNIIIQGGGRQAGDAADGVADPDDDAKPIRATNQNALNLAWRFLGFGDAHFANAKYADANARYRKAATAAPQLADCYFRQAYALIAMGRYDLAVGALQRGLKLQPDWPKSGFRNTELYADNPQAKVAHLETLAEASEKDPHNADLLFLVGVMLYFDGKEERARPFFERAVQLLAGNDTHVRAFLGD